MAFHFGAPVTLFFVLAKCPGLVFVAVIKYHDKSGVGEEKV